MVEKSDWFAAIVAVITLGAGLYMSTYRRAVIRGSGLALAALGIVGLVYWFGYYRNAADAQAPSISAPNSGSGNTVIIPGSNNTVTIGPGAESTASSRALKDLSNAQLRDASIDYAAKMRTFESNAQVNSPSPPKFFDKQSKAEQQSMSDAFAKKILQFGAQEELQFNNNYLGNARALRDEIILHLNRIGILAPYVEMTPFDDIGARVLDTGIVRGANPIFCAANYLEKLARRLPQ